MASASALPSRHFYGWRIVGVAFVVDFIAVGFFFYSYGVFFKPIATELGGGSRFGVGMGLSLSNVVGAFMAPFVGRALDRHSIRNIMILGAVCVALGFALLSRIDAIWQFYLILGSLFAFGLGMMGGFASSKLVANWFDAKRGTALGIATVGISLSGLVMPTAATALIEWVDWRGAFAIYAVCTFAIVVPVVAATVVNRPEEMGLLPDDAAPGEHPAGGSPLDETPWRTRWILRSRNFWAISLCFALAFATLSAVLTHLVPHADDLGIPRYRAAWILSGAAGAGVLGKVLYGRLFDHFDARVAIGSSLAAQLVGLLLLMQSTSYAALLGGGLVFGFGMGGVVPLQSAVIGSAFGRLSFGKAMGLMRPFQVPIQALGIPLAGWIYDETGSYDLAFRFFVASYVVACLAAAALRLPSRAGLSAKGPPPSAPR